MPGNPEWNGPGISQSHFVGLLGMSYFVLQQSVLVSSVNVDLDRRRFPGEHPVLAKIESREAFCIRFVSEQ
jgi:hypothetical protein